MTDPDVRDARFAEFVKRGIARSAEEVQFDVEGEWMPIWVRRDLLLQAIGVSDDPADDADDNKLNAVFHEWLERTVKKQQVPGVA
jgi:hypothetical protein